MTDVLLFLHIFTAIVLLGPLMMGHIFMPPTLRRGKDGLAVARFWHKVAGRLAPATLVVVLFGILLVEDLDIGYGYLWIWLALVLAIGATALGGALIGPTEDRAMNAIEAGVDAKRTILTVQLLGLLNILTLGVIVWLMVDKPL